MDIDEIFEAKDELSSNISTELPGWNGQENWEARDVYYVYYVYDVNYVYYVYWVY